MSPPEIAQLIGALGAIAGGGTVAGIAAYAVARRQTSGRIETTEAAKLWEASEEMRQELRDEVISLRKDRHQLRAEAILLRAEVDRLTSRVRELEERLARYETRNE